MSILYYVGHECFHLGKSCAKGLLGTRRTEPGSCDVSGVHTTLVRLALAELMV